MNNFIFAVNATLPIFIIIVIGYIIKRVGVINDEFAKVADRFVFKIALPFLVFKDIAEMDLRASFDLTYVLFCMIATSVMFLATWGITLIATKDGYFSASFTQSAARGSAAILGIALIQNIYGDSGMAPMMIVAAVPLYNVYSVIMLTCGAEKGKLCGKTLLNILKNVVTNPIILGIAAGVPFALLDITLPDAVNRAVDSVGSIATPLALVVIGATFSFKLARARLAPSVLAAVLKLFVFPALILPAAIALGIRDSALVAVLIMTGSPTTVSAVIMAKGMGGDGVLTSNTVILSTLFSSVSISLWIFMLKSFGLI